MHGVTAMVPLAGPVLVAVTVVAGDEGFVTDGDDQCVGDQFQHNNSPTPMLGCR